jgi:hypothetical protein
LIGVFPGSFDPLTVAHLAIADSAVAQLGLARLDLVLSAVALAKEHGGHSPVASRVAAIEALGLRARVTEARLIADIAAGYDACIVGADKWHQLHDVSFYGGSVVARDDALARLPLLAVVPRAEVVLPPALGDGAVLLEVDPALGEVSSSAVRAGRHDWRAG